MNIPDIEFKEGRTIPKENMSLVLRSCKSDMSAYGGFVWPRDGYVEAPDWKPEPSCGNGLHGLIDGKGDYNLLCNDWDAVWMVVSVDRSLCVSIDDDKIKFPWGYVVYAGTSREALKLILLNTKVVESTTGRYAHSSTTGYAAHSSTTGDAAHSSTTGRYAHSSTTGYAAHSSTTGYAAHSSTTGDDGIACSLGFDSRVKSSSGPMVAVWYDGNRRRVSVAYPGENGILPDRWYMLDEHGCFVLIEGEP